MTVERTGEAFEFDEKLTVVGRKLAPGDKAPGFALDHWDGSAMQTVRLADTAGKVRLLNIVNSLDTPVCEVETRRWERLRAGLPSDVVLYTVSMDLPWAMARWSTAENVEHQGLSSHRDDAFGRDYGVLLKEWRLLQRAVIVIGKDGTVALRRVRERPDAGAGLRRGRGRRAGRRIMTTHNARPFRFGVNLRAADSRADWIEKAKRVEDLGFSTLLIPDHLAELLPPLPALVAAAAATSKVRVGTFVLNNDFRHPVLLARDAATLDLLSDGRFELGIGAGHMQSEYTEAGIPFDPTPVRFERLGESVRIVKSLLAGEATTLKAATIRSPATRSTRCRPRSRARRS